MFNTIKLMYENRQLRKQVKLLERDKEGDRAVRAQFLLRAEKAEAERAQAISQAAEEAATSAQTIKDLAKRVNEAQSKLRQQTDADLFLAASRIIETIRAGDKPAPSLISDYEALRAQQEAFHQRAHAQARPHSMQPIDPLLVNMGAAASAVFR